MSVFLALLPSGDALDALRSHPRPEREGVRWEPERRWHVTVRYSSHVDDAIVAMLTEVADEVTAQLGPPAILLGPATIRLGRDGTLVVPATGAELLARVVDEALGDALGTRDHSFLGHLTIARLRRHRTLDPDLIGVPITASFEASELCLIESTSSPEGSVYEIHHRATFPPMAPPRP